MSGQFKRNSLRILAWLSHRRSWPLPRWISVVAELLGGYLLMATTAFAVAVGPFAWILRDGQESGTVQSTGLEAITKMFWCFEWGPILLVLMATTYWVRRLYRR